MKNTPFVLNNRFQADPGVNSLSDQETGKAVRLEPRLMNVLCFLAANVNQLVTREQLIKEVWNNYGGADEGLNQAISFLRKVLDDPDKKIIKTIPTKGYVLSAAITDALVAEEKATNETSRNKEWPAEIKRKSMKIFWIAALGLIVIIAVVSYRIWLSADETLPVLSIKPMPDIKTEVKPNLTIKPIPDLQPRDSLQLQDSIKR